MVNIHVKLLHRIRSTWKLLKSTSTSIYYSPSPILGPFSELSSQNKPVADIEKSILNSGTSAFDFNIVPEDLLDACRIIGRLKLICEMEKKMHITLNLQIKIEEIEELIKPETTSEAVWRNTSSQEKWEHFFHHPEDYECYARFIESVKAFYNNDPETCAKMVVQLHTALSLAVKRYAYCRRVESAIFHDEKFQKLIECFKNTPIFFKET